MDRARTDLWRRSDVPVCKCSALSYTHAHCLCTKCRGRAVSRSTEYRHWASANLEAVDRDRDRERSPITVPADQTHSQASSPLSALAEPGNQQQAHVLLPRGAMGQDDESNTDHLESGDHEQEGIDTAPPSSTIVAACAATAGYPPETWTHRDVVHNDLIWSIVESLQLMDETNSSQQNFVDILQFGKDLYKRGLRVAPSSEISEEEVDGIWPKTWQGAMKLLEEEGYEHHKKLTVCLSDAHYCLWDTISPPQTKCKYCGESGKIPYYYLSLSDKASQIN